MRQFLLLLAWALGQTAMAGQLDGEFYRGERFGAIVLQASTQQWLMLDREYSGNNEFGGPVVDLKATSAIAGVLPTLHVSAFKRVDASLTPEFVLQTSRDAVLQKGGTLRPIEARLVNGKTVWTFLADVQQQGKPALLYYVLLEGVGACFSLQTVVPESALAETRQRIDELLLKARY